MSIFWQKVVNWNLNVSIFWQNPYFDLKNGLLGQCVQGMNFANKSCFWEVSIGVRNPWDSENRDKKGVSLGTLVDSRHTRAHNLLLTQDGVSYSLRSLWRDYGFHSQCLKMSHKYLTFELSRQKSVKVTVVWTFFLVDAKIIWKTLKDTKRR